MTPADPAMRAVQRRRRELAERVELLVAIEATGETSPGEMDWINDEIGFLRDLARITLRARHDELRRLQAQHDKLLALDGS